MRNHHPEQITIDGQPLRVGDTIEFRAVTRSGSRKAVRRVTGLDPITVTKFHGWVNFIIRPHEVIRIWEGSQ